VISYEISEEDLTNYYNHDLENDVIVPFDIVTVSSGANSPGCVDFVVTYIVPCTCGPNHMDISQCNCEQLGGSAPYEGSYNRVFCDGDEDNQITI